MGTAPENEAKIIKGNKSSHNSHTTPPGNRKGENGVGGGNQSENVTFVTFIGFLVCVVFFFKSQGFWKPMRLFPPLPYCPTPFPICWVCSLGFPKKDKHPEGDKWPHSRREAVSVSGKWNPPTKACLIFKAAMPCFQIILSEHPLETVIFLSFLPAMGFHISEINYELCRQATFTAEQAGWGSPQCLYFNPDTQRWRQNKIKYNLKGTTVP